MRKISSIVECEDRVIMMFFMLAVVLPISTAFWIASALISSSDEGESSSTPIRWFLSVLVPLIVAAWGVRKRSLDYTGAIAGLCVGFILTYSNYCYLSALLCFFVTSSKATNFRSRQKRRLEDNFKEGGQRNWLQVFCNGGVAAELAAIYLIDQGCGERLIDFYSDYRASWLSVGVLSALACSNGDTWASEFGSVIGSSSPRLITSMRKVPKGTNGGVSVVGLICSALGGGLIGVAFYCCMLLSISYHALQGSYPQWPVIVIGAVAGFVGSLIDSVLGATFQYSGLDESSGRIVDHPATGVRHLSGLPILDNHSVNLISSLITALLIPFATVHVWDLF